VKIFLQYREDNQLVRCSQQGRFFFEIKESAIANCNRVSDLGKVTYEIRGLLNKGTSSSVLMASCDDNDQTFMMLRFIVVSQHN
jgi:hypothetical protein